MSDIPQQSGVGYALIMHATSANPVPKFHLRVILVAAGLLFSFASACATTGAKVGSTKTTQSLENKDRSPRITPAGIHLTSDRPTDARLCVGWGFGCAIAEGDTLQCWGGGINTGGNAPAMGSIDLKGLHDVTRVACGETNSVGANACALTRSGDLSCWGALFTGSSPRMAQVPEKVLDHVVDIKTGADRACALTEDGLLHCWGANYRGQLGDGTTNAWAVPTTLPGLGAVYDFGLEGFGGCAIGVDGEVRCWGEGPCSPSGGRKMTPRLVPGLRGARWVSSREPLYVIDAKGDFVGYHCSDTERGIELNEQIRLKGAVRAYDSVDRLCVVRVDESVHCLERGGLGGSVQVLGVGLASSTFVEVPKLKGAKEIALTRFHGCASFSDGLRCFGDNRGGALGAGAGSMGNAWLTVRERAREIPAAPPPIAQPLALAAVGAGSPKTNPVAAPAFVCPSSGAASLLTNHQMSPLQASIARTNALVCLDGTVTGLLITSSFAVPSLRWDQSPPHLSPQAAYSGGYMFATGESGLGALGFPAPSGAKASDIQFLRGDGKPYVKYALGLAPNSSNPWNLTKAAHLVRVRVNDGYGSLIGSSFLASDVVILDNTKEYPLDPMTVLSGFLEPLATETSSEGQHWRTLLTAEVNKKMKQDKQFSTFAAEVPDRHFLGGFHATWDPKSEELRVGFYARLVENRVHEERNRDPHAGQIWCHAPPGADCAPQRIPETFRTSITHSGEYAVRAAFSKTGALLRREESPVESQ